MMNNSRTLHLKPLGDMLLSCGLAKKGQSCAEHFADKDNNKQDRYMITSFEKFKLEKCKAFSMVVKNPIVFQRYYQCICQFDRKFPFYVATMVVEKFVIFVILRS